MTEQLPFMLALVAAIVLIEMLAKKLRIAYPVLLVVAGLLISFVPGLPAVQVDPDMIFFIFLPPLLFEAAWSVSFKEMKKWWRMIGSFAFLVVLFSALAVAVLTNYFIPGFTLALGFLLGGIVSPPDAVSTNAITGFVKIPRSTSAILEGESLLNDASSLIIFRFALVPEEEQKLKIRNELAAYTIRFLKEKQHQGFALKEPLVLMLEKWESKLRQPEESRMNASTKKNYLEVLNNQRNFVAGLNKNSQYDEAIIRWQINQIDLEEERIKLM